MSLQTTLKRSFTLSGITLHSGQVSKMTVHPAPSNTGINFKRIDLINSILPQSFFLIPIREPLQHAFSLLQQHLRFNQLQKNDKIRLSK